MGLYRRVGQVGEKEKERLNTILDQLDESWRRDSRPGQPCQAGADLDHPCRALLCLQLRGCPGQPGSHKEYLFFWIPKWTVRQWIKFPLQRPSLHHPPPPRKLW